MTSGLLKDLIVQSEQNEKVLNARDRSRLETRRRLMQAGAELFAVDGYEKTSVAAITEKARVASGTLFFHFKNKEGLFKEIALYYLNELHEKLIQSDKISAENIEHAVRIHTETIVHFIEENRSLSAIIINRMNSGSEVGHMLTQILVNEQIDRLNEGISEGLFRKDIDIEIAAHGTIAMLFGVMNWWLNKQSNTDIKNLIDTLTKIRLSGIYNNALPEGG